MTDHPDLHGPESWFFGNASAPDVPYAFNEEGWLVRASGLASVERVAHMGGRPLSGRWADAGRSVVFADVLRGLMRFDPASGTVEALASATCDGAPVLYVDDVRVLAGGDVVFSSASAHSPLWRGTAGPGPGRAEQDAPVRLELIAGGRGSGRLMLLRAQRDSGIASAPLRNAAGLTAFEPCPALLLDGLHFANGVALAPADEDLPPGVPYRRWAGENTRGGETAPPVDVLVTATFGDAVSRVSLPADRAAAPVVTRAWSTSFPALLDNVSPGPGGTWLVALPTARSLSLHAMWASRALRWVVSRLPWALWPAAEPFGGVLQLDASGRQIRSWVDLSGRALPFVTSATWVDCDVVLGGGGGTEGGVVQSLCAGRAPGHGVMLLGSLKTPGLSVLHVPPGAQAKADGPESRSPSGPADDEL